MNRIYRLILLGLTLTGLVGCGANSMFEAEMTEPALEALPQADEAVVIPTGCISWFDGCNTCKVKDGEISGCTKMACKSGQGKKMCRQYAPGLAGQNNQLNAIKKAQSEVEPPQTMPEKQREVTADIPENCKIWFDGCNSCVVMGGKLRGCTTKSCSTQQTASCTKE